MAVWRDVEHCRSAMVRQLHDVWATKCPAHGLPDRAAFDPAEIKTLLPNLLISELEDDPFRVRYRLVGTRVAAASGYDFTGRYLDEMAMASGTELWRGHYRDMRDSRSPLFGAVMLPTSDGATFTYEFGIFPVSTDGINVTQCLGIEDYGDYNHRLDELRERFEMRRPGPIPAKD